MEFISSIKQICIKLLLKRFKRGLLINNQFFFKNKNKLFHLSNLLSLLYIMQNKNWNTSKIRVDENFFLIFVKSFFK